MAYENSDFTVPSSSQLSHLRNSRPCSFQCFVESLLELSTLSSRFPPAFQQFVTELREHGKEWMFLIGLLAARLQEANHVFFFFSRFSPAKALMLRIHADLPAHPSTSLDKVLGTSQLGDG